MTEQCEKEYEFTLILDGVAGLTKEIEDALFEAGCDDSTISLSYGRMYITFARSAVSFKDAILSAIKNVRSSGIGATVLRIDECDLVNQSEIGRRIDRTRQLVNQYISGQRGPGGFPPPACNITDGAPLWYWCEVAGWLFKNDFIKEDVYNEVQQKAIINSVLEYEYQKESTPELTENIARELELC